MGLSALDLLSRFTGWFSLGCSVWSAMPQIIVLLRLPEKGGPSFSLLIAWLVGDAALVAGMYLTDAPITQKFSGIWFGIGDIIIMALLIVGRSTLRRRYRQHQQSHVKISHKNVIRTRPRKRWWKADSWQLNLLIGGVLTVGTLILWYILDVRDRAVTQPLEPSKAPVDQNSWTGWILGIAGLLCYNVFRWVQIYKIRRRRSMENISLWMFGWLLAQNVTMLISILTVSHSPDAIFGQAPFLANATLALLADIAIVWLHSRYHGKTSSSESPPQVPEPTQAGLLRAAPPFVLREVEAGEPFEGSWVEGPWSGDSSEHDGHAGNEPDTQLDFRQKLHSLEQKWKSSLSQEVAFLDDYKVLPWTARGQKETSLNQRAYEETQLWQLLDAEAYGSKDRAKQRQFAQWFVDTEAVRNKLKICRGKRRQLMRQQKRMDTAGAASSDTEHYKRSPSSLGKILAEESRLGEFATFTLPRRHRARTLGRFYPRRGVGTYRALADSLQNSTL